MEGAGCAAGVVKSAGMSKSVKSEEMRIMWMSMVTALTFRLKAEAT